MKINDLTLNEGINDPHIFKAVFTLGGPGSGKTTLATKLLGGSGLRHIDVDKFYELMMKKSPIAGKYEKELYRHAGKKSDKLLQLVLKGRLGVLVDGTGRHLIRLQQTKNLLEELGYDTMAMFVNVDIKTSIERNEKRSRKVPTEYLKTFHEQVRNNLGDIQRLFGNKLLIIDNSETPSPEEMSYYAKELDRFLNQPPSKLAAKEWKENQKK